MHNKHTHEHLPLLYRVTDVEIAKFSMPQIKRQVNAFICYIPHRHPSP